MNLFLVDHCPTLAARALCDSHVVKMILETAQILDGATRPAAYNLHPRGHHEVVKIPASQVNNPVIRSAAALSVWDWAFEHLNALLIEYTFRYGRRHAYMDQGVPAELAERRRMVNGALPSGGRFRLAMPERYRPSDTMVATLDLGYAVAAYRRYYVAEKLGAGRRRATWTRSPPPPWLQRKAHESGLQRRSTGRLWYFEEVA